ncbi:peptide-methionine (S)-S-oxide reductase MsrA [Candidatus Curtissbacteria bacterium]|nr:peptide-methionine (S)-S-oxide reductase MsrA [Candidatus Curtissbacteria bacterium]
MKTRNETTLFAGGCFWCTEAVFRRLKGVVSVIPGYSGGNPSAGGKKPSYEQVSSGTTGHAEVIQIKFDPKAISYDQLLEIFFKLHDPTTLNRQGADVGTQYRSAIFYRNSEQKKLAENLISRLEKSGTYQSRIVTEVSPLKAFYPAEDYHKDYYEKNSAAPYCQVVIDPKIKKLYKEFSDQIKEGYKNRFYRSQNYQ